MKRHIGALKNTGQRCVVVFMQIPTREDHALICATDSLPPRIEDALMTTLESPEGQNDPVLGTVLDRRYMPDMGEKSILRALHELGLLTAVPIDNVIMYPLPSMPFPLRQILQDMGRIVNESAPSNVPNSAAEVKYNPYDSTDLQANEKARGKANAYLIEAQLLEEEAMRKREEAYRYDPSLRPRAVRPEPTVQPSPVVVAVEEKTVTVKKPRAKKAA